MPKVTIDNVMVEVPAGTTILSAARQAGIKIPTLCYLEDVQAIGAAAQNMALQATSMGIGSLWIGNIFFAYEELTEWLGKGQMVLAMAFGYPNHNPCPLARKSEDEVIEVRD